MLTLHTLRSIRESYVSSTLDNIPSLVELCREAEVEDEAGIKQVRRACSKENWEAHRQKRKSKLNNALAKREEAMIDRIADDMIKKRETFIRQAIKEVDDNLPAMLDELKARIDSGFFDDKALVQAIKLLMESRKSVVEIIQKEFHHQDKQKDKEIDRGLGVMRDLGMLSKVADAVEGRLNLGMIEDGTIDVANDQDARHREALAILDAEVVGEG